VVIAMRKVIPLLLILVLAGCIPMLQPQRDCDEVSAVQLRGLFAGQYSVDQFRAWAARTYGISAEEVQVEPASKEKDDWSIHWAMAGATYAAGLRGSKVLGAGVTYGSNPPSADRVLSCLGAPGEYRAAFDKMVEASQLSLDLLFPAQGILASGARFAAFNQRQPPPLNENFAVSSFVVVPPGSAEQVLRQVYGGLSNDQYEKVVREFKPWPGDWENLQIQIDPAIGK
jgi:hypothetical protein